MEANKDGAQVLLENRSICYPYSDLLCKYHCVHSIRIFSKISADPYYKPSSFTIMCHFV